MKPLGVNLVTQEGERISEEGALVFVGVQPMVLQMFQHFLQLPEVSLALIL